MNGTSVVSMATVGNPGSAWRAIGAGDFNGDGNADILFQNINGTPMIWEMNGTSIATSATLPNPGITNIAIGTSDFNGDGNADILFQNINGTPLIWDMNGSSIMSTTTFPNPGFQWRLQDDGPIPAGQMGSGSGSHQPAPHLSSPDTAPAGLAHSAPDASIAAAVAPQFMGRLPLFGGLPT
jgi:hypothetical protein